MMKKQEEILNHNRLSKIIEHSRSRRDRRVRVDKFIHKYIDSSGVEYIKGDS